MTRHETRRHDTRRHDMTRHDGPLQVEAAAQLFSVTEAVTLKRLAL